MSGCCERVPVCVGGKSYNAYISYDANGNYQSGHYIDNTFVKIPLVSNGFTWGACDLSTLDDVFRVVQALPAGNTVITHNLGRSDVEVEARNNATGADYSFRVVAETANTITIFVPVATPVLRISIDA